MGLGLMSMRDTRRSAEPVGAFSASTCSDHRALPAGNRLQNRTPETVHKSRLPRIAALLLVTPPRPVRSLAAMYVQAVDRLTLATYAQAALLHCSPGRLSHRGAIIQ